MGALREQETLNVQARPQIHSFFWMCPPQGLMGFIGPVGEPGIVGEKVSECDGDGPSGLVFFPSGKRLQILRHLPVVLTSHVLREPMSLYPQSTCLHP